MTQKEDTRTEGRKREGDETDGQQCTLYFLCIVSCGGVIYRFTSHTDRRPCTGGRRHSSFHGITRPRPKVSLPPHPRAPHVACESFGSERQVREDNRIRHRYKTNRKEEEDFTERKEGGMDGRRASGWVVAVADAGHTAALHAWHRWRPAAATMTHGAEYWGGLHFSTDFTRHARWTRPREGARRSLA